ncbi:MAG: hypothetical protein HY868_22300 [Chloroflexi bacterium]|nr:hypothetical protein [Chloroflexota bacterium]
MARHFNHLVIMRAPGLLPMLYTPRELEDELGIPALTIREWIKQGMPHERDARGHLWINGVTFAGWVEQVQKTKSQITLAADEAYCLKCRQAVKLSDAQPSRLAKLTVLHGICPNCGGTIHRGV